MKRGPSTMLFVARCLVSASFAGCVDSGARDDAGETVFIGEEQGLVEESLGGDIDKDSFEEKEEFVLSPAAHAAEEGADLVTPQYAVSIPVEEKRLYGLTYSSSYGGDSSGLSAGMQTNVIVKGETGALSASNTLFQVVVISDNWGPQGAFLSRNLGHPSMMGGSTVYVLQPIWATDGSRAEDMTAEYAEWVTVF